MTARKLLLFVLTLCPMTLMAQVSEESVQQAERVFSFLLHNQTDSLYALFDESVKAQLPREQLEGGLKQVERMMGSYQRHGEWERKQDERYEVLMSVVDFEDGQLACVVSFDDARHIQGLRIMPLPKEQTEINIPLPADAVEVDDTVRTGADIKLPCSVVLSGRSARPPMVVFVHGSGPTDRNETVMANRPFLDLSRQLAERGISSLRYDKRTLVYPKLVDTMDDETILDALSAVQLARTYADRVFLLGHSLGAMLAPIIASRIQLDGIVMMAAPARDLADVVQEQLDYLSPPATAEQRETAIGQMRQLSPHYFQPQHQVEAAKGLDIPMLILQGERDYQVTMQDFRLWQQALDGKSKVRFASYPALNHLFLEGEGKSTPQEYSIPDTIPAQVVEDIARFITQDYSLNK